MVLDDDLDDEAAGDESQWAWMPDDEVGALKCRLRAMTSGELRAYARGLGVRGTKKSSRKRLSERILKANAERRGAPARIRLRQALDGLR